MNQNQSGQLPQQIKRLLSKEWDPIGVSDTSGAENEYDAYVPHATWLVEKKVSKKKIFSFLWEIETKHMGLTGNRVATTEIARKLFNLGQ